LRPFEPIIGNPDLLTLAAWLWPRQLNEARYPVEANLISTDRDVQVLVHTQRHPKARGEVVLLHGLEGSSSSGYMVSMARALLQAGYTVHRFNMRTCGGTEFLCRTLYHGGLTTDLAAFLLELKAPAHLVGFSLGGNVVLKLAGEMGSDANRLISSVCTVSTPLDLGMCARRLGHPRNRAYEWHFVRSMKQRLHLRRKLLGDSVRWDALPLIRSLYDLDDQVTAPAFGFRDAENYYSTQSAAGFLDRITVPTKIIHAKDDPMIPLEAYSHEALARNSNITIQITDRGGHIGFLSRTGPRFWIDGQVCEWLG
jgi:predicted alpha/beta-fold hydrolase